MMHYQLMQVVDMFGNYNFIFITTFILLPEFKFIYSYIYLFIYFSSISRSQLKALQDTVCSTGDVMSVKMLEGFLNKVYFELKNAKDETKHLEDVLER